MTIQIGRFVSDAISSISRSGDSLSLAGITKTTTGDGETFARIQQINGLIGSDDEEVFPLVSTQRPDLDGFYRVTDVSIDEVKGLTKSVGMIRWSVTLIRVAGGFARPSIEVTYTAAALETVHTVADRARLSFPSNARDFSGFSSSYTTELDPGGSTDLLRNTDETTLPVSDSLNYFVSPGDFYFGAPTFEQYDGTNWWPVVGRQFAPVSDGGWRISNGLIRLSPLLSGPDYCYLIETWDQPTNAWETLITLQRGIKKPAGWEAKDFGVDVPDAGTGFAQPILFRNSPTGVVVRIPQHLGTETISMRRGAGFVTIGLADNNSTQFGVGSLSAVAVTDSVHMMEQTTATSGRKFFVGCPVDNTVDAVNGRIWIDTPGGEAQFLVGRNLPLLGSVSESDYAFSVVAERQEVVSR